MWSNAGCYNSARRGRDAMGYTFGERTLHFFPFYHSMGGSGILMPTFLVAGTLVMQRKFSVSTFLPTVLEHRITMTSLNGMHVQMLLSLPRSDLDRAHQIRRAQFALEIPPQDRAAFSDRFGIRLVEIYGSTESVGIVIASPVWSMHTTSAIGVPLPDFETRIVDSFGQSVGVDQRGELQLRSHLLGGLCDGYYADPQATADLFKDGWMATGDVGYFDGDGYFHFVGRSKDMIKRNGFSVSPAEVERVLREYPSITDAAVVGIPDQLRGEAVVAFVKVHPDAALELDAVQLFCADRLAPHKRPTFIHVVDEFPQNELGKVLKTELRTFAAARFRTTS
jgi:crotonobetaine/carnitine-CoA ligase